jgi:hypothetical protein
MSGRGMRAAWILARYVLIFAAGSTLNWILGAVFPGVGDNWSSWWLIFPDMAVALLVIYATRERGARDVSRPVAGGDEHGGS